MKRIFLALSCLLACSTATPAAITYYYANPYYGRSDSPFYQSIVDGTIYLEDFEDYRLNTPYVTSIGGGWVPDSPDVTVDEDDGKRDGKGIGGGAWRLRPSDHQPIEFSFTTNVNGDLPSFLGAVLLTKIYGGTLDGSEIYDSILVFDSAGVEITQGTWKTLRPTVPVGTPFEDSGADRFVGIYYPDGISKVVFSNSGLIDHLQYGYAIPEPSAAGLLAVAGCFGLAARRRGAPRFRAPVPSSSAAAPSPPMPG